MDRQLERVEAVGAVVVRSDGHVLVVRRGKAPSKGAWSLPGGRVGPGETREGAIEREVREETGLEVRAAVEVAVVPIDREGYAYVIHEYLCVPRRDEMRFTTPAPSLTPGDDADDARWVAPGDLAALGVSVEAREVVERALARVERDEHDRVVRSGAMKTTHTCPKCKNEEVLFLPQIADRDDDDTVRPLSAHVVHFGWKEDAEIGKIQAYVCFACGYTELYTNEVPQIPWQKVPGAKLLTPRDARLTGKPPKT